MNSRQLLLKVGAIFGVLALVVTLFAWWPEGTMQEAADGEIWTCSMHPQIRLKNAGVCPICGMKLIPVSQLPNAKDDLEKRAGLETEPIVRRELFKEIRTVGKLDYSERQVELITARIAGRVDRLYVDFTGIEVKENDHLVDIYSPELYSAQSELLRSLEAYEGRGSNSDRFAESNLAASREKLRLFGLLPKQITEIERTKKEQTHVTIHSPLHGTVVEKFVRNGQYVKEGDPLYRIANLDPIWLYLNIYEVDMAWVRFGQAVDVTLEAFAGETIRGTVTFIDPFLDDATRTIRVRVNLKNADRRLKPQMYAKATIRVPLRVDGTPGPTGTEGQFICPMHPEVMQPDPGKCNICEMALEQVPELTEVVVPSDTQRTMSDLAMLRGDHSKMQMNAELSSESADHHEHSTMDMPDSMIMEGGSANETNKGELAIPVSAVLDTGRRQITYRLTPDGAYELVELKLGSRALALDDAKHQRDYYLVLDGIKENDQVVVQSGFLLDSQRQIEGMPSLLYPNGQAASMSGHAGHAGMSTNASDANPTPPPVTSMPPSHQH